MAVEGLLRSAPLASRGKSMREGLANMRLNPTVRPWRSRGAGLLRAVRRVNPIVSKRCNSS